MSRLLVSQTVRGEIEADALARYPEEACGVLIGERSLGRGGDRDSLARAVRVEENVHLGDRGRRFAIAPERLLAIQKDARTSGWEVLGYYHSHPDSPAVPSRTDLEAAWPETSYLIVSVAAGVVVEIRSWRLAGNSSGFAEEEIEYRAG